MLLCVELVGPPEHGPYVAETEPANGLTLEVVSSLAGFDEREAPLRKQDREGKPWDPGARAEVRESCGVREHACKRSGVQNQPIEDRSRRPVRREVHAPGPRREELAEIEEKVGSAGRGSEAKRVDRRDELVPSLAALPGVGHTRSTWNSGLAGLTVPVTVST